MPTGVCDPYLLRRRARKLTMLGFSRLASNNSKEQRGGGAPDTAAASQSPPAPGLAAHRPLGARLPGGGCPAGLCLARLYGQRRGGGDLQTGQLAGNLKAATVTKKRRRINGQRLSYLRFRPSSRLNCPRSRGGSQHSHPWMFRQSSPG